MRITLPLLLALLGSGAAANPIAEVLCDGTARLEERLKTRMNLTREASGLRGPDQILDIWTTPRGDWTLVASYASGQSCILAMGEAWQGGLAAADPM